MTGEHVVLISTLGEPTLGLWCESCALPSAVELTVVLISERGSDVATVRRCVDCCDG